MSAEVVKSKDTKPEAPQNPSLRAIRLVNSALFNGTESEHIRVEKGHCVRYWAIRFETDGSPVPLGPNQRADGFALECDIHNRITNKVETQRIVVPLVGIRQFIY